MTIHLHDWLCREELNASQITFFLAILRGTTHIHTHKTTHEQKVTDSDIDH